MFNAIYRVKWICGANAGKTEIITQSGLCSRMLVWTKGLVISPVGSTVTGSYEIVKVLSVTKA